MCTGIFFPKMSLSGILIFSRAILEEGSSKRKFISFFKESGLSPENYFYY